MISHVILIHQQADEKPGGTEETSDKGETLNIIERAHLIFKKDGRT